jgi:Domain of unknown function (DUF4388)/FHA domain
MPARQPLALRFLSGRYQGGVVPLEAGRPFVIGRQPGLELVLPEDLVSRRHARLSLEGDDLVIEDLGSTNGTYVNGVRMTRARIAEGDRILIGGSLIKLVAREAAPAATAAEVRASLERAAVTAEPKRASAMQGRLEEVPLPDLLQLFGTARKTGVLTIQRDVHAAEIHFDKGRVVACAIDGRDDLTPEKSFYRLLGWSSGHFELRPAGGAPEGQRPISESIEGLLMEGMRQLDELRRLRGKLPAHVAADTSPAEEVDVEDRALLALAAQHGSVDAVLDATPLPDLAAAERLVSLLARGLLVAAV